MNIFDRIFHRRTLNRAADHISAKRAISNASCFEIDDQFLGRLRKLTFITQRRLASGVTGEHLSSRLGDALEFADYRSYTPGDDFRRVDWNAYQRLGHLFVKLANAPERVALYILLDVSSSMGCGTPEKLAYSRQISIGLAYVALSHMDSVTLMLLSGESCSRFSRLIGSSSIAGFIRSLSSISPSGTTNLDSALNSFANLAHHRGLIVLISDLLSPTGFQAGLSRLSRSSLRPVVIHVLSQEELHPILEGDVELLDVETGDTIQVSVDWDTLTSYQRWIGEWLSSIEDYCARHGIVYVRAQTSQPIEELLLDRLRREKVLR